MELDIAHEVRRVSASLLAFDRSAQTLTFRPVGATPVGIEADEQTLRNWLQGALLSVETVPGRAQPHERAIDEGVHKAVSEKLAEFEETAQDLSEQLEQIRKVDLQRFGKEDDGVQALDGLVLDLLHVGLVLLRQDDARDPRPARGEHLLLDPADR